MLRLAKAVRGWLTREPGTVHHGSARVRQGKLSWLCHLIKSSGNSGSSTITPSGRSTPPGRARRFIAEKGDGSDCHVVAALSLRELLNRLDEIVADQ